MASKNSPANSQRETAVLDTNVIVVADGSNSHPVDECQSNCLQVLRKVQEAVLRIVLDEQGFILKEYARRFRASAKGIGAKFIIWLWQNQYTQCLLVNPQPEDDSGENFALFPNDPNLSCFDRADRKFVATAVAAQKVLHSQVVPIINAIDSDWYDYLDHLRHNGIQVRFICPKKMPKKECS